jgi:hypothetical protein
MGRHISTEATQDRRSDSDQSLVAVSGSWLSSAPSPLPFRPLTRSNRSKTSDAPHQRKLGGQSAVGLGCPKAGEFAFENRRSLRPVKVQSTWLELIVVCPRVSLQRALGG